MKKIIITPMIGIGDVLMTTPIIELIKKYIPDSKITFCVMNKGTYEVLRENPFIDDLAYYPLLGKSKLTTIIQFMLKHSLKYDLCINFYPSNRIHYNIFSFLTFAPFRMGHRYLRMNFSQLNWLKNKTIPENDSLHCVEENLKILQLMGVETETDQSTKIKIYLNNKELLDGIEFRKNHGGSGCCAGIHAGTSVLKGHEARRWPKEKFSQLINKHPDIRFFVFGTIEEEETNQFLLKNALHSNVVLINNKSIREVAAIIAAMDFFISNDSGLMHLSVAVNTPVIAIIGPTNPVYIHPWNIPHKIIKTNLSCQHCFKYSPKPLDCTNQEHFACLKGISTEMVDTAVSEFKNCYTRRSN
jgi:heptosyltransferase-2